MKNLLKLLEQRKFFRPDEVAQLLLLSRRTVYRMIRDGRLQAVAFGGGTWRIPCHSLAGVLSGEMIPQERLSDLVAGAGPSKVTRSSPS